MLECKGVAEAARDRDALSEPLALELTEAQAERDKDCCTDGDASREAVGLLETGLLTKKGEWEPETDPVSLCREEGERLAVEDWHRVGERLTSALSLAVKEGGIELPLDLDALCEAEGGMLALALRWVLADGGKVGVAESDSQGLGVGLAGALSLAVLEGDRELEPVNVASREGKTKSLAKALGEELVQKERV